MGTGRDQLPARRHGRDRDAVRRRQRLPRDARQRRGGPPGVRARHLPQRLPRDLGDPARRGGVRLRAHRPDHRQRPRHQGPQDLRRRRAADVRHRRPRGVRAHPGLPRRRAAPQPGVAHAVGQAGADQLDPHGVDDPATPGDHDARGRDAVRRGADRHLLADPQPAGRHRRVPLARASARQCRPAQGGGVRRAGADAADELRQRRPDAARLPVRPLRHDDRGRGGPHPADRGRARDHHQLRRRHGQDGLPGARHRGPHDPAAEDRRLPLLARGARARAVRPVRPHARPGRPASGWTTTSTTSRPGTPASGRPPTSRSSATTRSCGPSSRRSATTCSDWPRRPDGPTGWASPPRG